MTATGVGTVLQSPSQGGLSKEGPRAPGRDETQLELAEDTAARCCSTRSTPELPALGPHPLTPVPDSQFVTVNLRAPSMSSGANAGSWTKTATRTSSSPDRRCLAPGGLRSRGGSSTRTLWVFLTSRNVATPFRPVARPLTNEFRRVPSRGGQAQNPGRSFDRVSRPARRARDSSR
jgi:hypothetical protein